jgi:hypothetical protein
MAGVTGFTDLTGPIEAVGGVTFAGHHTIAQSIFERSDFFKALNDAKLFNGNNFAANGIPLPNTPAARVARINQSEEM